jgi:hypothetical protein
MIVVYKLLADAEYTRPCVGAKSDALGEAILQADLRDGRLFYNQHQQQMPVAAVIDRG